MKKVIFIINGSGGKGKDKFVEYCSEFIPVLNISSVDKVKEAARILGWNEEKNDNARLFLARLKFDSSEYNNQPYEYMKRNIEYFRRDDTPLALMFIHIREPEEIDKVKNDFNCKTLIVKNLNVKDIKTNDADANVYNYNYDYTIDNSSSLESLKQEAYKFVNSMF